MNLRDIRNFIFGITRRLPAVQDTITRFKAGEHTARSSVSGVDEAASIASQLNTLRDTLAEQRSALVRNEAKYKLLLQNIRAAVIVHGADTRILMSNPTAQELLGLSEEQMLGKAAIDPAWHFLREDGSSMPSEEYPVNRVLTGRQPVRDLIVGVQRPDRDSLSWFLANAEPAPNDQGEIGEIIVTFVDITRRKRVEEALRKREAELNEAQRIAHIGHWERDLKNERVTLSAESYRIFGLTPQDHFLDLAEWHEQWKELIHPEDRLQTAQAAADAIQGGSVYDVEYRVIRPSGEVRVIRSQGEVTKDESGRPLRMFGTMQDITELKQAEEALTRLNEELERRVADRTADMLRKSEELKNSQVALMNIVEDLNEKTSQLEQANNKLKEVDQLKSMFIASMSHELRTPLNSIIGFSSIILNEWSGPLNTEQKENVAAVLRSGKHLLSLINDVIDVSKIEAGKIDSILEDFDVHDVVMEAVETLTKDIEKKGLELIVQTPRLSIHTDRRRLLQCLLNLLSNALKFTNRGSIGVYAELSADGSMMTIAVEDTGIGIEEDDLGRLFSPFVRLHTPRTSIVPGTGLGLYLAHKLAHEILKGDIVVQSTYGEGSRFTLRVPVN